MIKICYFVEGQTERIFLEKLIFEYLGYQKINIKSFKLIGTRLREIRGPNLISNTEYHVRIFDVGNDERVASVLTEIGESLITFGFSYLFGLRDVHPRKKSEIPKILSSFHRRIEKTNCKDKATLLFSIMQIEAWFLADHNVFKSINKKLTPKHIKNQIGVDLENIDIESIKNPSSTINKIMNIVGLSYQKHEKQTYKITSKLDYTYLICSEDIAKKCRSFSNFMESLDRCLKQN